MPEAPEPTPLARALGRVPTGLFVATTTGPDGPQGFVASLVVQLGLDPPVVGLAVGKARGPLEAIRQSGRFALSILDGASQALMAPFFKKHPEGEGPFDHLEHRPAPGGAPILPGALAWLDCTVTGEHELADHVVVFGRVEAGELLREGDPTIHLRKDGLSY